MNEKPEKYPRQCQFGALTIGALYGAAVACAVVDLGTKMNGFGLSSKTSILALVLLLLGVLSGLSVDMSGTRMTVDTRNRALWLLAIGMFLYLLVRPGIQVAR